MNTHEINKMTMFNSIIAVLASNQEIVNARPPLAKATDNFNELVETIERRNNEYINVAEGAVAEKNKAIDDLIERVSRLGNAVFALGRETGSELYKSAGTVSFNDLKHMREADITQYCSKIAGIARECAEQLVAFEITAEEVDGLNKALDNYRLLFKTKEVKIAEKRAARKALYQSFDKADDILANGIDRLMELVKTGHPDFYNQYKAARSIRDLGGHFSKTGIPVETNLPNPPVIAKAA